VNRLPAQIESAFQSGSLIVTSSARTARWLRQEYALKMREAGRQAWQTPPIEDWDNWLRNLWHDVSLHSESMPLLLTPLQEKRVWRHMQKDDASLMVSPDGMAQLSAGAYSLLCKYQAHAERNHTWLQPDAEHFQQWAAAFDRECGRQQWISSSHLETQIASALEATPATLPDELLLVGFDRLTPAQETLLAELRARGILVASLHQEQATEQIQLFRAEDPRDEMATCAWWARRLIEEKNGNIRIGIIAPDAASLRGEMERILRRILMPEADDISANTSAMPFEFSLGQPLATVPVIRAALLLLQWATTSLREEEISWLLLSGFLTAAHDEMLAAARFDAFQRDRRSLSMEISLAALREALQPSRWSPLINLQTRLLQMEKFLTANDFSNAERDPSRWMELAQTLLQLSGWASGGNPDTVQFQAMARWNRILDDIALLDFDQNRITYAEFLRILTSHASETIFSPESTGAPVQILGALEASGQCFDALWFLGADEGSWPLRGRMHPLLPYDIQQKLSMPHANPEDDLELSRTITTNLLASAPNIVISHAARNRDGELRPSPVIEAAASGIVWKDSTHWRDRLSIPEERHTPAAIEKLEDASGMIPWPMEQHAGGSDVLKEQAACPFRAFALKRLRAQTLNRSDWGLTASERGEILHRVLENIWSPEFGQLHTLEELQAAMRENRLHQIAQTAIAKVFATRLDETPGEDTWLRAYLSSEQQRLQIRIEEWLELEAVRAPFEVIACEEELQDVSVGGLKLHLRADRIDQVADYARLLIDYKTGQVATTDWKSSRPDDPQLPLYAVFGNVEDVCGVVFARIRAGETSIAGMVADAKTQLLPNLTSSSSLVKNPYSQGVRDAWSEALLNLAHDFLHGEAAVDPKDGRTTCKHCPLSGLCRIAEQSPPLQETLAESSDD
jgi:ATP-dependent helicase/nuclease subunit B